MVTIDGYLIDASLSEGHKYKATVTKYPVESGSPVADNVTSEPKEVTIEGIVSNTPLGSIVTARQSQQATPDSSLEFLPSDDALAKLEKLYEAHEPITIETSLKRYENMVLVDLDVPRDESTGDALRFTAMFEQVKIVTNNRTTVRVASPNNGTKKKKTAVIKKVFGGLPGGDARPVRTNDGRWAVWNKDKGRYEYAGNLDPANNGRDMPNGVPVPNSQLSKAKEQALADDQALLAQEDKINKTYFDYQRDEWVNTDGSAVTQQQLDAMQATPTQGGGEVKTLPWWNIPIRSQ